MAVNPTFGVDNFNKPRIMNETETIVSDFLMILFGKPGFYPSIPDLGIDISRYLFLFEDEINIQSIKLDIISQCQDFRSYVNDGTFDVIKTQYNGQTMLLFVLPMIRTNDRSLVIGVTTDESGNFIYNFIESKRQVI